MFSWRCNDEWYTPDCYKKHDYVAGNTPVTSYYNCFAAHSLGIYSIVTCYQYLYWTLLCFLQSLLITFHWQTLQNQYHSQVLCWIYIPFKRLLCDGMWRKECNEKCERQQAKVRDFSSLFTQVASTGKTDICIIIIM